MGVGFFLPDVEFRIEPSENPVKRNQDVRRKDEEGGSGLTYSHTYDVGLCIKTTLNITRLAIS